MSAIDPEEYFDPETVQRLHALLRMPGVADVFAALGPAHVRIVGGAVRNALLGLPVTDIDFATTWPPDVAMDRLREAGFSVYPVGIDHGSIVAVKNGRAFEVTTLRRDVKTDGRHAVVEFGHDWTEDARRRDFTINALYLDARGKLHDYASALPDLKARRLRFIGDAGRRMREDYLRILRFFRFWANYADEMPDDATLAAIARERQGLGRISKERIRQEMQRLLPAPKVVEALRLMLRTEVADLVFPAACARDLTALQRMVKQDEANELPPDWFLRLLAFCGVREELADAFRLTREEVKRLRRLAEMEPAVDDEGWKRVIYRYGADAAMDMARLAAARGKMPPDGLRAVRALAETWRPPAFHLAGKDVVKLGLPPGPHVGEALRRAEERFIAQGFTPTGHKDQFALLRKVVAEMKRQ